MIIKIVTTIFLFYISISIGYNLNSRIMDNIDYENSEEVFDNSINSSSSSSLSSIDNCIPVRAVKQLGCSASERSSLFKEVFQSVCEQHQLCYVCGFAHSITAGLCDKLALLNMYELCIQNQTSLPYSDCLKKRFLAIKLLRQYVYRSASTNLEFFFECQQGCVADYLYTK